MRSLVQVINIDGTNLRIIIKRKKIKNISFKIDEDLNICVSCPLRVGDSEIYSLLNKNLKPLERMLNKVRKNIKDNNKVMYLGNELNYIYYKTIMIDAKNAFGPSIDKVNEYLENNSLPYFQKRLDIYLKEFNDIPKFRLRIRKMKTRWGVCNKSSMTITLNSLLIHKKVDLIDYVIVHELSHFKHMDHSASFWLEVEKHYKDYKKARKELR